MANNISYDFVKYAPKDLGVFTENITQVMPTNPVFSSFKEEVDRLKALYALLWTAYLVALKGGSDRIADRNACQDELILQLLVVAFLVKSKAVRNPSIVPDSGYKARKQSKTAAPEVEPPTNLSGSDITTKLGAVDLTWKGSAGTTSYSIESRPKGQTEWTNRKNTTRQSITLEGYTSGTYVEFRVCGHGTGSSTSDWSVSIMVLIS